VPDRYTRTAPRARDRAARDCEIELADRLDEQRELVGTRAYGSGQLGEEARDLLAFLGGGLRLTVVQLDDLERLDEQRLTRVRRIVDDSGNAAARGDLHREHGTSGAFG